MHTSEADEWSNERHGVKMERTPKIAAGEVNICLERSRVYSNRYAARQLFSSAYDARISS